MEASGGWEGEQGRPSKGRDCRWARKGSRANMNKNGASGQPWRTPECMGIGVVRLPLIFIVAVVCVCKSLIREMRGCGKWWCDRVAKR